MIDPLGLAPGNLIEDSLIGLSHEQKSNINSVIQAYNHGFVSLEDMASNIILNGGSVEKIPAISVQESNNNIIITANVIVDNQMLQKDSRGKYIYPGKYPREAYEQAVVDGITSQWSGDYKGKNIVTQFNLLKEASSIQRVISITIDGKNGKSTGSRLKKKEIKMHICNGMNVYNLTELGLIAAQEFGHTAFDLDDLYNKKNEGIPKTILSVMNDAKNMPRQEVDFAMMATNEIFKDTSIYIGEVNGVKVTPLDVAKYYVGL